MHLSPGGLGASHPDRSRLFASLSTYSRIVARLSWDPQAIDLSADARAWPGLPETRRRRLATLLAGFCVAEEAVAEHLVPFADATEKTNSMMMWIFFLQRRDEDRHALMFDRIAAEVLGLPGASAAARRVAGRDLVPPAILELFEVTLPAMAADLAAGRTRVCDGIGLYHMVLEGMVFSAAQRALLDDLADDVLPGVREGVQHVELDERWHVGFGLRCLTEEGCPVNLDEVLALAMQAADAWGDVVPAATRQRSLDLCRRRLALAGRGARRTAAA
ncbi:MAG TPA: hypothetical protein VG325_00700 [Solirubrobacteraceae bacterium]|nr:hypothetical protein [Solirubrobacteraceae bacterium]